MAYQANFMAYMIATKLCNLISEIAKQKKLDLVLVNEGVVPFICKLVDYREHMYERFKREYLSKYMEKGWLIRDADEKQDQGTNLTSYA